MKIEGIEQLPMHLQITLPERTGSGTETITLRGEYIIYLNYERDWGEVYLLKEDEATYALFHLVEGDTQHELLGDFAHTYSAESVIEFCRENDKTSYQRFVIVEHPEGECPYELDDLPEGCSVYERIEHFPVYESESDEGSRSSEEASHAASSSEASSRIDGEE